MRKKILFVSLLCVLLLMISIPTAYAYMIKQTGTVKNVIIPAQLSAKVNETFTNNRTKTSVKAQNTSNIEVYLRMRIVTYWEDSKGNRVVKDSPVLTGFTPKSEWITGANNTYYYSEPLDPGEETKEFLRENLVLEGESILVNNVYYDYYPVVEFITEVVQSKPISAVTEVWPVTISNGKITSAN